MIASIQGEILQKGEDYLVLNVGGVGLMVLVTAALCQQAQAGSKIFMHTHLVVREDSLTLYGFEHEEERTFFNLLMGVSGVGPRLSLVILSTLSVEAIRRAVLAEQYEVFSRVSGIGKKTAQKIALHLQDKVSDEGIAVSLVASDVDGEVLEALTALGYSVVEAQTALQSIPKDTPDDVETRLLIALQYFNQ